MKYYLTQTGREFIKEEDGPAVQGVKAFERGMEGVGVGQTTQAQKAIEASREAEAEAKAKEDARRIKKSKKKPKKKPK